MQNLSTPTHSTTRHSPNAPPSHRSRRSSRPFPPCSPPLAAQLTSPLSRDACSVSAVHSTNSSDTDTCYPNTYPSPTLNPPPTSCASSCPSDISWPLPLSHPPQPYPTPSLSGGSTAAHERQPLLTRLQDSLRRKRQMVLAELQSTQINGLTSGGVDVRAGQWTHGHRGGGCEMCVALMQFERICGEPGGGGEVEI
eukprot:GHVQ01023611.1.p1 GENE.GHVQ01023611.1~~GHVQ01023611.1.p1  ORF type:complete len:196 (-),score=36.87 GHVQ01023611.1:34-621(-)